MELGERLTELERRIAALESAAEEKPAEGGGGEDGGGAAPGEQDTFWALRRWKAELSGHGLHHGGVLFTGAVEMPDGRQYEWQQGASTDDVLEEDWTVAVDSFAALGHPVRMRLMREIHGAPRRTVAELASLEELGTTGQIYHHLRQLTSTGWLRTVARGRYEVPPERVVPLMVMLAAARR
ncbi:helix-turn-helix domain-containing protein [Streptomyces sp. HNM0574]|uniref:winged helix-turn-helix domain-containing protein n=1 Tax=Streptomyces sp. HNM0574 TaxID=2714954 RepID=UPI00146A1DFA|nr:helix-turn-helix domain-containing protein [Streptomyces sp. HNM0574]NLU68962.1 helix-turn-helix transcriptional regulator [Streptomyces sp. HNM0574]